MPINCPMGHNFNSYLCDGTCAHYREETCTWHRPPVSIHDILTTDELFRLLFARIQTLTVVVNERAPSRVLSQMRKDLNDTRGMLLNFQQKFNERYGEEKKKKAKKKPTGAVETS